MATNGIDDTLLETLTTEEIGELAELIDPDNSCLHPSERMPPQTTKEPTGPFQRDHLLVYLKQEAENSKVGEDYIPYKKEIRGKVYKLKEPVETVRKETKKSKFAEELDQMLSLVDQDDLADLASELGLDEISSRLQTQSATSNKANPGAGLVNTSVYSYRRSGSPVAYSEPDLQETDIEESISCLQELDPNLVNLNLNNHPKLDESLFQQLCDALVPNTYLTSLQLAGTRLGDNQAKMLVPVLKHNFTLQSLNLDSNCLTGAGVKTVLTALQENKSLREIKLSNQKCSFGAGIEMQMAKLISNNTTLLKFGFSFTSAGPRVLVEKYMMRNTETARQQKVLL